MILDELTVPIVLAPLAGGPSTPELAAAVTGAGGLGFVAAGYLRAEDLAERLRAARALGGGPLAVNVFVPGPGATSPERYAEFLTRVARLAETVELELGDPRYSDDDWEAKLELLAADPPEVVSFTFGCPSAAIITRLQGAGAEVWVTVTSVAEARQAQAAGADVLVVQGAEAGGHRASFLDVPGLEPVALLPLLALVSAAVALPLVATGGIMDGRGLAAVLCAGAAAGQLGSAFMLAPEAGTSETHRAALHREAPTVLTRAFTGRLARGIANRFTRELDGAPVAYPELHYMTAPLRAQARRRGESELINLWAGQGYSLARARPAAETVAAVAGETRAATALLSGAMR